MSMDRATKAVNSGPAGHHSGRMTNRRTFIKGVGAGAVALPAATAITQVPAFAAAASAGGPITIDTFTVAQMGSGTVMGVAMVDDIIGDQRNVEVDAAGSATIGGGSATLVPGTSSLVVTWANGPFDLSDCTEIYLPGGLVTNNHSIRLKSPGKVRQRTFSAAPGGAVANLAAYTTGVSSIIDLTAITSIELVLAAGSPTVTLGEVVARN